jgi:hypothetical protein
MPKHLFLFIRTLAADQAAFVALCHKHVSTQARKESVMRYKTMIALIALCGVMICRPVSAAPEDHCNVRKPAPINTYRTQAMSITDFIREKQTDQNGVFLQKTLMVPFKEGQIVWMEGWLRQNAFSVMDTIHIEASPSGLTWERSFGRDRRNRLQISEGPQELTHLFVPGDNRLTVTLENRHEAMYGATPLGLSIWEPCIPPTRTPTSTPWMTPTPRLQPSVTPVLSSSPTATAVINAAVVILPTLTPKTVATAFPVTERHSAVLPDLSAESPPQLPKAVSLWLGLTLAGGALWWVRRHYRPVR